MALDGGAHGLAGDLEARGDVANRRRQRLQDRPDLNGVGEIVDRNAAFLEKIREIVNVKSIAYPARSIS